MRCPNCGNIIADDSAFCSHCGARISGYAQPAYRQGNAYTSTYSQENNNAQDYSQNYDYNDNYNAYSPEYDDGGYDEADDYGAGKSNKGMVGVLIAMGCIIVVLVIVLLFIIFSDKNKKPTTVDEPKASVTDQMNDTPSASASSALTSGVTPQTSANANASTTNPTPSATTAGAILPGTYKVNTQQDDLNIRAGAGADQVIVGRVPKDTVVTVTAVNGNWAYITYNGVSGWVSTVYLLAVIG